MAKHKHKPKLVVCPVKPKPPVVVRVQARRSVPPSKAG